MGLEGGARERQRGLIRQMLDVLMGMPRFKVRLSLARLPQLART